MRAKLVSVRAPDAWQPVVCPHLDDAVRALQAFRIGISLTVSPSIGAICLAGGTTSSRQSIYILVLSSASDHCLGLLVYQLLGELVDYRGCLAATNVIFDRDILHEFEDPHGVPVPEGVEYRGEVGWI